MIARIYYRMFSMQISCMVW